MPAMYTEFVSIRCPSRISVPIVTISTDAISDLALSLSKGPHRETTPDTSPAPSPRTPLLPTSSFLSPPPRPRAAWFPQIARFFYRFFIARGPDDDAGPSGDVESHRKERRRQHVGPRLHGVQ